MQQVKSATQTVAWLMKNRPMLPTTEAQTGSNKHDFRVAKNGCKPWSAAESPGAVDGASRRFTAGLEHTAL